MMNAPAAADVAAVPGCLGRVADGILPGLVGFELGQSALGDAFHWLSTLTGRSVRGLAVLAAAEHDAATRAGAAGALDEALMLDFLNGR